jgi:hypothetical protein
LPVGLTKSPTVRGRGNFANWGPKGPSGGGRGIFEVLLKGNRETLCPLGSQGPIGGGGGTRRVPPEEAGRGPSRQ